MSAFRLPGIRGHENQYHQLRVYLESLRKGLGVEEALNAAGTAGFGPLKPPSDVSRADALKEAEKAAKEAEAKRAEKLRKQQEQEEVARKERERLKEEAARKAQEEKERKAREEEERKAKEEADRKAQEERKAREEAERKTREEAQRKTKEVADRKAQEDAEQQAREDAKKAADRKAQEEAGRKAKEDAERKAREEAERKMKEEADRKAREDAERTAKEDEETEVVETPDQLLRANAACFDFIRDQLNSKYATDETYFQDAKLTEVIDKANKTLVFIKCILDEKKGNEEIIKSLKLLEILDENGNVRFASTTKSFSYPTAKIDKNIVLKWVGMAKNAAYLATGLYAVIFNSPSVEATKQAIDSAAEGASPPAETVEAIRIVVAKNTGTLFFDEKILDDEEKKKVIQKIEKILDPIKKLFGGQAVPADEISDSIIRTSFLDHVRGFSELIVEELDDTTYKKVLSEWPKTSPGWSAVTADNGRIYPQKYFSITKRGKRKIILPSLDKGDFDEKFLSNIFTIDNVSGEQPFGYQYYSEIIGTTLFIAAVEQILKGAKPGIDASLIQTKIQAAYGKKVGGWRSPKEQITNYQDLIRTMRNIQKQKKTLKSSIGQLEVIEKLDVYKLEDGSYNHHLIHSELIYPVFEAIDEKFDEWSDSAYVTFERLGLIGQDLPLKVNPVLQTKYYHTLSLVADYIENPENTNLLDRIASEWPMDLVDQPILPVHKPGRTIDI